MLRTPTAPPARRGQALLITLSALALLALVGLTAVYFARDKAEEARIRGMTATAGAAGGGQEMPDDGLTAMNSFLSTLIYDAPDEGAGLANSLRGHSLMATMYGRVRDGQPDAYPTVPWAGAGTFGGTPFNGVDRRQLVNHRWFSGNTVVDPEYDGSRAITSGTPVAYTGTASYYPKNPAYTYPDIKDFYLASLCPATGEVLVPSFHRPYLFGSLAPPPANSNWTNAAGKYLTVRPRPQEHPNFPPVPGNGDSGVISPPVLYTGDVQNLPGGFGQAPRGVQKNDSIWIDIGLPTVSSGGRLLKPLVAPLVIDLDGRLNLSAHGNVLGAGAARHRSGEGLGPWEISLEQVLGAEGTTIVNARGTPQTRSGLPGKAFYESYASATELPQYAQVPWTGFTGPNALQLPGFGNSRFYATDPLYTNGYDATNARANFPNHPAMFNPHEWPTTGSPRAFPLSDTKILSARYAPSPSATAQLSFIPSAPAGSFPLLQGTLTPAGAPAANPYRTDPGHAYRHLFTTYSNSVGVTGLMPGTNEGKSPLAALAPIDLNRPLADYRDPAKLNQPLSEANIANAAAADLDRQKFATDIYARLLAAIDPTAVNDKGVVTVTVAAGNLDSLRALAQIAANIVDYIDNDDVSTQFRWNPAGTTLAESTVFGVERPRVVLNEAYAEVTNEPRDPAFRDAAAPPTTTASLDAHVRFWLELHNPTAAPYSAAATATHPLGTGSVTLKPYKVEIVRNTKGGGNVTNFLRLPTTTGNPGNVAGDLGVAADVEFDFSADATFAARVVGPAGGADPDFVVCAANVPDPVGGSLLKLPDFKPTAGANWISATAMGTPKTSLAYPIVLANALTANAVSAELKHHVVLLRRLANPYLGYDPNTNPYVTVDVLNHVAARDRILLENGKTRTDARKPKTTATGAGYDPTGESPDPNDPTILTVDATLRPQAFGKVQPYAGRSDASGTFPDSFVLPQNQDGVGGLAVKHQDNNARHTLGRANSRAPTPPAAKTLTYNNTTFKDELSYPGDATKTETIWTPYEWLVHLDRPLINQLELLHVAAGKPHELTTNFVVPAGGRVIPNQHTIYSRVTAQGTGDQLYRALGLLTVRPFGHQAALGGRNAGMVNINTIQDLRVWRALFDAQDDGSAPTPASYNSFNKAFVDDLWDRMITTRTANVVDKTDAAGTVHTKCPVPGATVHDGVASGNDRPFLPFGAAETTGGTTFAGGTGIGDTLLRGDGTYPLLVTRDTNGNVVEPEYRKVEAARKILNNTTTVSHTFAVWLTVGYFEVEGTPTASGQPGVPAVVRLGREFYREVPGDSRHKFFAVVDRAHVGIDPASFLVHQATPTTRPVHATVTPFHTTLETNVAANTATTFKISAGGGNAAGAVVYTNGTAVNITATAPNNTLVLGVGATRDIVTVSGVSYDAASGLAEVTVAAGAIRYDHYAGENVSNVVPGNPGPQPSFDVNAPAYRAVVPYWTRVP